jgi:hypothetical protein
MFQNVSDKIILSGEDAEDKGFVTDLLQALPSRQPSLV